MLLVVAAIISFIVSFIASFIALYVISPLQLMTVDISTLWLVIECM